MTTRRQLRWAMRAFGVAFSLSVLALAAEADDPAGKRTAADAEMTQARELFSRGTEFVQKAQWAEALAAFEGSFKFRPHAITTYNIGACQRALGRYTLARKTFVRALEESREHPGQLPETLTADTVGFVSEIDHLLVRLQLTLSPSNTEVALDGRPLELDQTSGEALFVAGTRPPGLPAPVPQGLATVLLDPGLHVFTLTRKGYSDVAVTRSFGPGSHTNLVLKLDRLPATLHVTSTVPGAIVLVDGVDIGPAPIDISRSAGVYDVRVRKPGFVPYEGKIRVNSGEEANVGVKMQEEVVPITQRWWFWTAAAVVLAGAAGGTYLATRSTPDPVRPPLDGGGLGWTLAVP
jgi:hypothetical protein